MAEPREKWTAEPKDSPGPNRETGSLTQSSPQESHFMGSSTGVFFVHTVKKAFAASSVRHSEDDIVLTFEQTVGGGEDPPTLPHASRADPKEFQLAVGPRQNVQAVISAGLGSFPAFHNAQRYAVEYFRKWHPLFPFLSGPAFLDDLQAVYQQSGLLTDPGPAIVDRQQFCNLVILRCVLLIGALSCADQDGFVSDAPSRSHILSLVSALATRHDLLTIQTILAAQLYCVSTMALRTASTMSGMLGRLLLHAGLHRCPYRYSLPEEQRALRKRIFWSAYVLDRYLCVALGLPVSLPDSEIDVCISGRKELHTPHGESPASVSATTETDFKVEQAQQNTTPSVHNSSSSHVPSESNGRNTVEGREETLANLVEFGRLDVLYLRSDVEKWFNSLPDVDASAPSLSQPNDQAARFLPFFHVMYEQLTISINRPALSLPRHLPEFHHGLQITIKSAKKTISGLERQSDLFWPGYTAGVWMSGLILAFASQVGLYSSAQAATEVQRCLALLTRMGKRWESVRLCHAALSEIHDELRHPPRRSTSDLDRVSPSAKRIRQDGPSPTSSMRETLTSALASTETADVLATDDANPMISGQDFATAQSLDLDMNDFFQDLSWDNLFDSGSYPSGNGRLFDY